MSELKAVILIDNIPKDALCGEWGLSIYIEYHDAKFLLDTGASGNFLRNAEQMGIHIDEVDYGILSHAHYDHSNGIPDFFRINPNAKFYLRKTAAENCFSKHFLIKAYIGIQKGTLQKYTERIVYADGKYPLCEGVWLLPHTTEGLENTGTKAKLYRKENHRFTADDFSHEQSLVFETSKGLIILNSCSHGGADNIITEVSHAFPQQKIYAMIGGFHLFRSSAAEVQAFAKRVQNTGIEKVMTGHCTGQKAFDEMKEILGASLFQLYTGFTFEI